MRRSNVTEAITRNQSHKCRVKGCNNKRYYLSGYCSFHKNRSYHWGHPLGKRLKSKQYQKEKEEVRPLIEKNKDHPGIKAAVFFLERYLEVNAELMLPGSYELSRLHWSKVTGLDCLIECAAVWVYFWRDPTGTWDTGQQLTYALAHNLFSLVPREILGESYNRKGQKKLVVRAITSTGKRRVGNDIRSNLGPLFMNIFGTLEQQAETRRLAKEAYSMPLQ